MRLSILILTIIAFAAIASAQDFVKVDGTVQLSGVSSDVFAEGIFADGWLFDIAGAGFTPSQTAFLKDNVDDGRPIGNVSPKHAWVGMMPRGP
jgi:hypothetical protein